MPSEAVRYRDARSVFHPTVGLLIGINAEVEPSRDRVPHCGIERRMPKPLTDVNETSAHGASMRGKSTGDVPSQRNRPHCRTKRNLMYSISRREAFSDTTFLWEVEAPDVAKSAEPGHFVMLRLHEGSERIPLTVAEIGRAHV